jgi:hypothetical protein
MFPIRAISEEHPYTSSSVVAKALQRKRHSSLIQRVLDVLQLAVQERGVTRTLLGA